MNILMVLTSHDKLGNTGEKTGFWLEEFAAPYYAFIDAGAKVTLVSPNGGQPPLDPKSDAEDAQTEDTERFKNDESAQSVLANTSKLADVSADDFDAIFYPGGHGPLWDLAESPESKKLIEAFNGGGKPIGAVCHAPAVFKNVVNSDGDPLVHGRRVTGFTNEEEEAVELTSIVPFLVEDMLKEKGAHYEKADAFTVKTIIDGNLVTGQNPPSSVETAQGLLSLLK